VVKKGREQKSLPIKEKKERELTDIRKSKIPYFFFLAL